MTLAVCQRNVWVFFTKKWNKFLKIVGFISMETVSSRAKAYLTIALFLVFPTLIFINKVRLFPFLEVNQDCRGNILVYVLWQPAKQWLRIKWWPDFKCLATWYLAAVTWQHDKPVQRLLILQRGDHHPEVQFHLQCFLPKFSFPRR